MPFSFYDRLSEGPETFRSFTVHAVVELDSLRSKIKSRYEVYVRKRPLRKDRKRDLRAGAPSSSPSRITSSCC